MTHCACWTRTPPVPHEDHCCLDHIDEATNTVTCGHQDTGMAAFRATAREEGMS